MKYIQNNQILMKFPPVSILLIRVAIFTLTPVAALAVIINGAIDK
jgi:hypothetical protein